jgi:glycosyltransferase involved in cell wall biosynthesis
LTRIVFCSKSTWHPAIRREHEIARLAIAAGNEVVFLERPTDIRALQQGRRQDWLKHLVRVDAHSEHGVSVIPRSTFVPGHRSSLAGRIDQSLLGTMVRRLGGDVIVTSFPWDWPAVASQRARRVFDCADDWSQILPERASRIRDLYRRISAEADEVICASDRLAELFEPRRATVVPNGTPAALLATPPSAQPRTSSMVYAGTLTERFDIQLVDAALERLPGWHLDLVGPCQYAGLGDAPDQSLAALVSRWPGRVTLHGPVDRDRLTSYLDAGDVLVMPHRRKGAVGGNIMKIYDYAARGRPFVTTPWTDRIEELVPPHTQIVTTPETFAAAVGSSAAEPAGHAVDRRQWAEANSWDARWPAWEKAVVG